MTDEDPKYQGLWDINGAILRWDGGEEQDQFLHEFLGWSVEELRTFARLREALAARPDTDEAWWAHDTRSQVLEIVQRELRELDGEDLQVGYLTMDGPLVTGQVVYQLEAGLLWGSDFGVEDSHRERVAEIGNQVAEQHAEILERLGDGDETHGTGWCAPSP